MSDVALSAPTGEVREPVLLEEPRRRVLHVRLPADVPRHLQHRSSATTRSICLGRDGGARPTTCGTIAALSVINACYTNIAMTTTSAGRGRPQERDAGRPFRRWCLPRRARDPRHPHRTSARRDRRPRSAPSSTASRSPTNTLPGASSLALVVGAACFCGLGPRGDRTDPERGGRPAIVNAIVLPLLFISDVFIPWTCRRLAGGGRELLPRQSTCSDSVRPPSIPSTTGRRFDRGDSRQSWRRGA